MTYSGKANIGLVCCNRHVKDLNPLAKYAQEALNKLEQSVDDPTVGIDDIGEQIHRYPPSIVSE